jgi:WbqC-like protein family
MQVAIMQPYFFPYIGYFQLIRSVDLFIVYDNIKYTKKGWINRNRFLRNGSDALFSLPLQHGSDVLDVRERTIAADFDRVRLLNQLAGAYRRAPCFQEAFALVENLILSDERNLFAFLHHSIAGVCEYLGIGTRIAVSSQIPIDHALHNEDRVIALCKAVGAGRYVNAIGGRTLYSAERFASGGIALTFLQSHPFEYPQFGHAFVPWLSIIDVIMFNSRDRIAEYLDSGYQLIE